MNDRDLQELRHREVQPVKYVLALQLNEHEEWLVSRGERGKLADLGGKELTDTDLDGRSLSMANMRGASLLGTSLRGANLEAADLREACLKDATLAGADLRNANLMGATLVGAELRNVNMAGASLRGANLQGANLENASGIRLDRTRTREARFSRPTFWSGSWIALRYRYTGVRTVFHLLFLGAFVFPLFLRGMFWVSMNETQAAAESAAAEIARRADSLLPGDPVAAAMLHEFAESVRSLEPCFSDECRSLPIWAILLGFEQGKWVIATGIALIVYNLLRGALTWGVAPLRDGEETTGWSPSYSDYRPWLWAHAVATALLMFSLVSATGAAGRILLTEVELPVPRDPQAAP